MLVRMRDNRNPLIAGGNAKFCSHKCSSLHNFKTGYEGFRFYAWPTLEQRGFGLHGSSYVQIPFNGICCLLPHWLNSWIWEPQTLRKLRDGRTVDIEQ